MVIRPVEPADLALVRQTLVDRWGSTIVVGHGERMDASALPGFLALDRDEPVGMITYSRTTRETRWPRAGAWRPGSSTR